MDCCRHSCVPESVAFCFLPWLMISQLRWPWCELGDNVFMWLSCKLTQGVYPAVVKHDNGKSSSIDDFPTSMHICVEDVPSFLYTSLSLPPRSFSCSSQDTVLACGLFSSKFKMMATPWSMRISNEPTGAHLGAHQKSLEHPHQLKNSRMQMFESKNLKLQLKKSML